MDPISETLTIAVHNKVDEYEYLIHILTDVDPPLSATLKWAKKNLKKYEDLLNG